MVQTLVSAFALALGGFTAAATPALTLLTSVGIGQRCEFRIDGVPAASNPFDPDIIRVDATVLQPSGKSVTAPAFWYQGYGRALSGGTEQLTVSGNPQWRLRFLPLESGTYTARVSIVTNGHAGPVSALLTFSTASTNAAPNFGVVGLSTNGQSFATTDGRAFPLIGANVCWPGARGTYDYDMWFPALAANHGNYARIWMAPWQFGIEAEPGSLTKYRLDRAWQLDHVLDLAAQKGIRLMLCLDYHGMFATQPDPTFGGGDDWKVNPYNTANGGPCAAANDFFTSTAARTIYEKRLRYLVARYGPSPNLFAWEFLNEIDNVYYGLQPADVAAWHGAVGAWLHANDPWGHLVTTSLTGGADRPEIWQLPQLDFTQYHSYGEPAPAARLASVSQSFLARYKKPVLIGEFGVDFRGWMRSSDPALRGFRQLLWGGALGGSAGTAMSWWWENLYSENVYILHSALYSVLGGTHWEQGGYQPIRFITSGAVPSTVGSSISGGAPFDIVLVPGGQWAAKPSGLLAVANPDSADYAATSLNAFVHGSAHADLKTPFKLNAWFGPGAQVVPHVDSVSTGAKLGIYIDNKLVLSTNLPDKDGLYNPTAKEYNIDIPAPVPTGQHTVELRNLGLDWLYLDYVRLEQVLPAQYAGNWQPSPSAIGLRGPVDALLYVVAPGVDYPAHATNAVLAAQSGKSVTLANWPAGAFAVRWYSTTNGAVAGEFSATTTNGVLTLPLPDFSEDLAGIVIAPPVFRGPQTSASGGFQFDVVGPQGYSYEIDRSAGLSEWSPWASGWFLAGPTPLSDVETNRAEFYRARWGN